MMHDEPNAMPQESAQMHHSRPSSMEAKPAGITLSPKASFILGLVGGVMVLCTIGFVVLLCIMLRGGQLGGSAYVPTPSPSQVAAAPSGAAPSKAAPTDAIGTVGPVTSADHVRGVKNGQVTLIEWSDFQCPYCGRFHPTMQQLMNDPDFKGKLTWAYRHYPLSFHPNATPAANAAECASAQGKFWEFADELFGNQDSLSDAYYGQVADKLGLNRKNFDSCYAAKKYQSVITADQAAGTTAGITGTPGTIIIGKDGKKQLVPGAVPYETLKQMVQSAM
ncbi:MAG: hypothetical protein RLZZ324_28 [Candidatus Parcubacteria bacterium]|jgi:protein-disulfide isomerase